MTLVVVSSAESVTSKTRTLASAALSLVGGGELIDLHDLPAEGLLGRHRDQAVIDAVASASAASVLVLATPVYRATFNGSLKCFLDQFSTEALAHTAVVLVATAATPAHYLSLDTSGRSVVASLGGWTVPTVVYATGEDFTDGVPDEAVVGRLSAALDEARLVATALSAPTRKEN